MIGLRPVLESDYPLIQQWVNHPEVWRYMDYELPSSLEDVRDDIERYRFALAAYNTGSGHIDDARRLARGDKKDAKKWREVAPYVLRLSQRKYASRTRFGYCRGAEPVDYVRHIDERFAGYAQLVPR